MTRKVDDEVELAVDARTNLTAPGKLDLADQVGRASARETENQPFQIKNQPAGLRKRKFVRSESHHDRIAGLLRQRLGDPQMPAQATRRIEQQANAHRPS